MEPCRGGRLASLSEPANAVLKAAAPERSIASWAFRYVAEKSNVGVILSGMTQMDQAEDNLSTFSGDTAFTDAEREALTQALEIFRGELNVPCTACHYCDGCPRGLNIPALLKVYNQSRFEAGMSIVLAMERLGEGQDPANCISCGSCVKKCPQNINIPQTMADFTGVLAKLPARK
jgi:hypothetical protein